jgi:hypothetical protein
MNILTLIISHLKIKYLGYGSNELPKRQIWKRLASASTMFIAQMRMEK